MKGHQVFMTKETNALELEFSKKKKRRPLFSGATVRELEFRTEAEMLTDEMFQPV